MTLKFRNALKAVRGSQPFNCVSTTVVKAVMSATGLQSELVVKHLHRVGIVRVKLPNGRVLSLWSRGDDWITNQVYWRGWSGYEPDTVPLFFRLSQRSQVTLDVGAYVGYYSLLAALANPSGQVYAFEPLNSIYRRLERNVALNQLSNIECIASAVGEIDGTAEFFHTENELPSCSTMSQEFIKPWAASFQSSTVPIMTLDRFVREKHLSRVDLLKIDTESTEPDVLRGMHETLRRDRPSILCEVLAGQGSEKTLAEILQPLGYRFYLLTAEGPMLQDSISGHPNCLNYLFTTLDANGVARL